MNRGITIMVGAGLLAAGPLFAATAKPADPPPAEQKTIVTDTAIQSNDSPLVRAAKMTAAARQRDAAKKTGVVINDAYLKAHPGGRISESTSQAPVPQLPPEAKKDAGPTSDVNEKNIAEVKRRAAALTRELGQMVEQMDDPYGGTTNMDPDKARLRALQIQKELEELNKRLPQPAKSQ